MKVIIAPENCDQALRRWQGGVAKMWLYHISLKRLALRIERPTEAEVLYVVGSGCTHIHGPFVWNNANIAISNHRDPVTGENICQVTDAFAGFELFCSTVTLAGGPANEVDESFGTFLGEVQS